MSGGIRLNGRESILRLKRLILAAAMLFSTVGQAYAATTNLTVKVYDEFGRLTPDVTVSRYSRAGAFLGRLTTDAGGLATWTNIEARTHSLRLDYNGEYWGSYSATARLGTTTTVSLLRQEPCVYAGFKVYRGSAEVTGGTVPARTPLRYQIDLFSRSSEARSIRVRFRTDRDQVSPYDFGQEGGPQTIARGGSSRFTFNYVPRDAGAYNSSFEIEALIDGRWIKTDGWSWGLTTTVVPGDGNLVQLNTWFSATQGDHFTTTDPRWAGGLGTVNRVGGGSGYVLIRQEGLVFSPDRPQPGGTVPLYSFFHPGRADNFLTSDPRWAGATSLGGYSRVRLEGYVYATSQPGLAPLRSLWSPSREDNYASTDPRLQVDLVRDPDPGEGTVSIEGGRYTHYRVEGFMFPPADLPPSRGSLRGLVDMHTHLMSHLGFGRKLIHGAPDVGSILPAGTRECNPGELRATSIGQALGHDNATHGGHDFFNNTCGNHLRILALNLIEGLNGAQSVHGADKGGWPSFQHWPKHNDLTHQQMWVDWIRRSHAHGLRVMVSLAVNNSALAGLVQGDPPYDDLTSADVQLREMRSFVERHSDFMEVALSAGDLRRIVGAGKLAVILGIELDDLGNFQRAPSGTVTREAINAEIDRLHGLGVRYVFPIHLMNNPFGGAAAYEPFFNVLNRVQAGAWWNLECSPSVGWRFAMDPFAQDLLRLFAGTGTPSAPGCPEGQGHRNALGLTSEGYSLIDALMRRGMLIDVDHMSERAVDQVLTVSRDFPGGWGYPLASGHNGPRGPGGSERSLRPDQMEAIRDRGGLLGLGWAGTDAAGFRNNLLAANALMGTGRVAFGTDINGFSPQPRPRPGSAVAMGWTTGGRTWNYNVDGVANYGMLPELVEDLRNLDRAAPLTEKAGIDFLYDAAESFARTWERAELAARSANP